MIGDIKVGEKKLGSFLNSVLLTKLISSIYKHFSLQISDANGEMITREIIIGIVTQRDLLNYITNSSNGNAILNEDC